MAQAIASINQTLYGISGQNGLQGDLKAFRREFQAYVREEQARREREAEKEEERKVAASKDRANWQRALILALLAAVIALIGTVASLLVVAG